MDQTPSSVPRRIVDAAYELFYRKGFHRTSIDEVAALAGLTKRTLYYHFQSKDDLLKAALELHGELAMARFVKHEHRYSGSANEMLDELRGVKLLAGVRGMSARDREAVVEAIVRLSWFANDFKNEVSEMDINPLMVYEQGAGARVLDALIVRATVCG